jgi:excisionase family DNA binding protein
MDSQEKDIMTVLELCAYLQLSEAKVRDLLRRRELPAVLIGRQWRIRRSAIDRWLAEQEDKQGARARQVTELAQLERQIKGTEGLLKVKRRQQSRLGRALVWAEERREDQEPLSPKPQGRQSQVIEGAGAGAHKPLPGSGKGAGGEGKSRTTRGAGTGARPGTGSRPRGKER